jgi:hypothetical protein
MYIEPLPQAGGWGGTMFYIGMFCYSNTVLKIHLVALHSNVYEPPSHLWGGGDVHILVGRNTSC